MTGKNLHTKEANAARLARGVKAVAWIEIGGVMRELDATNIADARGLAEHGIAHGASSASYRVVGPDGKTKVVEILSPHDDCNWM